MLVMDVQGLIGTQSININYMSLPSLSDNGFDILIVPPLRILLDILSDQRILHENVSQEILIKTNRMYLF